MAESQPIRKYVPRKEDVVRIVVIDLPTEKKPGEGLYERTYSGQKELMDLLTLEKELVELAPPHPFLTVDQVVANILDRLQNFRKVYINTATGEISS